MARWIERGDVRATSNDKKRVEDGDGVFAVTVRGDDKVTGENSQQAPNVNHRPTTNNNNALLLNNPSIHQYTPTLDFICMAYFHISSLHQCASAGNNAFSQFKKGTEQWATK